MLEIPHVLVGAAIATNVENPYLSIPLAFLSHLLIDKIPHWNPHFYTETNKLGKPKRSSTVIALTDSVGALLIGTFISLKALPNTSQFLNILFCCLAAVASDQVKIPYYYFKIRSGWIKRWTDFERAIQEDTNVYLGSFTQIVVCLISIWWMVGNK
jgi:hypothetical protein